METHNHATGYGKLAAHATAHCLVGCGLGEIVGFIIGTTLGLVAWQSIAIGVMLGFVFGFSLGIIPLVKAGQTPLQAFKLIFIAEFVSIAVMETAEVLTEIYFPGMMNGSLTNPMFWLGMLVALLAGFIAAYPVNYYTIKKGINHHHH